jgi:hypothetical protein
MENLCPVMLTAAVAVKPPVSHNAMVLPSVYDENSMLCKREEHVYTVRWIMQEYTFLQRYISRGRYLSDQYK